MTEQALLQRVAAIGDDHTSGATRLAGQAVDILQDAHQLETAVVERVARALCVAQPSMAAVWLAAALAVGPDGSARLSRLHTRLTRAPGAIVGVASDLLVGRAPSSKRSLTLVTVSASSTVRRCLERLAALTSLRVLCAEGRPLYEGRRLARALSQSGIGVTLCTDAALGELVASADPPFDAGLIGADAVSPEWFMNKCSTRALVSAATLVGVPVYAAVSRPSFVHALLAREMRQREGPGFEVWESPPAGLTLANPYFDRLPVDVVTLFLTDAGAVGAGSVPDVCQAGLEDATAERLLTILHAR